MFKKIKHRVKWHLRRKLSRLAATPDDLQAVSLNRTFNYVYNLVPKVTSVAEHVTLFNLARFSRYNIVEVGSYISLTSVIMASAFPRGSERKVYAIDMFDRQRGFTKGDLDNWLFKSEDQFEVATRIIYECGFPKAVCLRKGKSVDFYNQLESFGKTDLVFIDGDHSFDCCINDARAFSKIVEPGGFVVFHDYFCARWPGVRPAVSKFLEENHAFEIYANVDSMLVTRRKAE